MATDVQVGSRVIVPFGQRKILTAIVATLHGNPPENYVPKYVLELLDDAPMVTPFQIKMFDWMAQYYMCHVGEVMNIALPAGLKISSLSRIQLRPDAVLEGKKFTDKELKLLDFLKDGEAPTYDEAADAIDTENIYQVIKSLITKEVVLVFEEIRDRYQPKMLKKVRLTKDYLTKGEQDKLLKKLEKFPRQADIFLAYLRQVPVFRDWTLNENGLPKAVLQQIENFSDSALRTLTKNDVFEEFEIVVSRFEEYDFEPTYIIRLSEAQQRAMDSIMQVFEKQPVALLQGVTGSGKTEIYIELIQKVLASGSQVLFLLPEIALTTQIVSRLRKVFGSSMGVYHSKFSDNERVEVWQGIISGRFSFVVGVRSAIFLPFDNLGLIIVDEEHETSYKQQDPAPRYHARDMALVMARLQHCKVLLGSATPSIETYYNAKNGRFGLVQLKERFGDAALPAIELANLKEERKQKTNKSFFTAQLINGIQDALNRKEQVILFQNRRGYSPYVTCKECAWIPDCKNCDVSLTYHLEAHLLRCHYCGYEEPLPKRCNVCGSTRIETIGLGTERIEDELKLFIPEARVQRMDLDTTRSKYGYQQIINDFEQHNIDILVGTQMISKGLDFDNVSLVGIFDADKMLHFPDFRAHERAFQMLLQVSGRAGRKDRKGRVIIQTNKPDQTILGHIIAHDYESMYLTEIEDRAYYFYPPFTRVIRLITKHLEKDVSEKAALTLAENLQVKLGKARVLGPQPNIVNRIRNMYLFNLLLKIERENVDLNAVKQFIREKVEEILSEKEFKKVQIVVDVDPA
ncbi:MAG: primosomal protein N' [Bacteroidetes bacterium]|nr:MAG: primosomal protein N' [Bacteroidota bacterium]